MVAEPDHPEAVPTNDARFETLVEHSPVAVVLTDAEAIIQWVSPALTPMLGHLSHEVIGTSAADLHPP